MPAPPIPVMARPTIRTVLDGATPISCSSCQLEPTHLDSKFGFLVSRVNLPERREPTSNKKTASMKVYFNEKYWKTLPLPAISAFYSAKLGLSKLTNTVESKIM